MAENKKPIVGPPVEPDGFCAWGEEKGNEQIRGSAGPHRR